MKYLLLGYGTANQSVEKFLIKSNISYEIYDDYILDYKKEINLNNIIKIVKSSGIRNSHPLITQAIINQIPIVTDIELFYHFFPNRKYITITGSNGKTTTVSLLKNIFMKASIDINLGGNIGKPIFDFYDSQNDFIIEASSFMLEYINNYHPNVACFLNISFAHLDHHKSLDSYIKAKSNLIKNQQQNDFVVFNQEDEKISLMIEQAKALKIPFSRKKKVNGAYKIGPHLYFQDEYIISQDEIKLIGNHNIDNILACICIAKCLNINNKYIQEAVRDFRGIPHRIEYLGMYKQMKVYNDSKSTNLFALKNALNSFDNEEIILICGGKYREDNFDIINDSLKNINKIFVYGENRNVFYSYFIKHNKEVYSSVSLEEVITILKEQTLKGDILLFSPASSSQDQFKNFEERGRKFKSYML